ncbi:4-hydroxy-2-oxo-heptane-1,7-dioate aldolase [Corticibacter populi]|uniref:4-hydroxy-2-oxo-heptane-1,7-dioate aldolase n=1 Tax=Corticibacter populi TaxID=1550736 RepID=A0A3M6QW98_9BURK|nr:HpcH/HpaI aldolase/citrate lyase family protein [Corticibacter populi]RMX06869.1 4-hydroxy-2-oxo-heptane-1,7-dioate aldolase [Corticibacter populi]RZS31539.1 2,4-dihydroxyhept-2-enedioate aldolase [Corticibacter populi]
MLPVNHFKRALREGQPQIGIWSTIPSPFVSELIGGAGYDWVLMDTEHTPTDVPLMLEQLRALAAAQPAPGTLPTHAVVRPAWNDTVLIKRYLDLGAQTLLLPFVQNAQEAESAVRAMRYAPEGIRGMGGSTRASNFGRTTDYVARAADELCLLVQVETAEALDQIEAIAAVDGVDGIFIGPADLSASLGYAGQMRHPEVTRIINDALARIRATGKASGILMVDAQRARECLDLGVQFIAVALDTILLRDAMDAAAARFGRSATGAGATTSY